MRQLAQGVLASVTMAIASPVFADPTLKAANDVLFEQLRTVHNLSPERIQQVQGIFARSGFIGQGNPAITRHPMTTEQCRANIPGGDFGYADPGNESICGSAYMAPLYDPQTQSSTDAKACIDQFEFPNVPCIYPVVWTKASEAAEICAAVGKRMCDAHEWEGACAGALEPPDYRFDLAVGTSENAAVKRMRAAHNNKYKPNQTWSYGPSYAPGICAAASRKSSNCQGGGYRSCGSNTYPTGSFPECKSTLGVYDINGNAAEHMNLPLTPDQMASAGSTSLGVTEMKGSWFIFDKYRAHPDWCRWRAPYWHGSRVKSSHSHANYHLGFRCCKTLQ